MKSVMKKENHAGVLTTQSQNQVNSFKGMLPTLSCSGHLNCHMVSKPNVRSRVQSDRACELSISGL